LIFPISLPQFVADNLRWTQQQVQLLAASDPYWAQVGLNLAMLRGITAGYNQVHSALTFLSLLQRFFLAPIPFLSHSPITQNPFQFYAGSAPLMSFTRILIANWDSDISGVTAHLYPHTRLSLKLSPLELRRHMRQNMHCSAAVQVAPDLSDV
jgi:hypothetical protein